MRSQHSAQTQRRLPSTQSSQLIAGLMHSSSSRCPSRESADRLDQWAQPAVDKRVSLPHLANQSVVVVILVAGQIVLFRFVQIVEVLQHAALLRFLGFGVQFLPRADRLVYGISQMGFAAFEVAGTLVVLVWMQESSTSLALRYLATKPLTCAGHASLEKFGIALPVWRQLLLAFGDDASSSAVWFLLLILLLFCEQTRAISFTIWFKTRSL